MQGDYQRKRGHRNRRQRNVDRDTRNDNENRENRECRDRMVAEAQDKCDALIKKREEMDQLVSQN